MKNPPYFEGMKSEPAPIADIKRGRILGIFANSITTDHISPAGSIKKDSPAGKYLMEHGVQPADFNSYGARRGNHEVMMRGTFANIRIRNEMLGGKEGGNTLYYDGGSRGRRDADLRRGDEVSGGRHADDHHRGQGIRLAARRATTRRRGRCCSASAP